MALVATLAGGLPSVYWPPLSDDMFRQSIQQAIAYQQEAIEQKTVDWLYVSGQPQRDVVGIFASGLGLEGDGNPYIVNRDIGYLRPITLDELRIAFESGGQPLKAHITGPTLIAEACKLSDTAPARYRDDSAYPRELTLDLARALAAEAEQIARAGLPIPFIQIDEPTLVYGADLDLAREAVALIVEPLQGSSIKTILHVCGDVGDIVEQLLDFPVDILNFELQHINEIEGLDASRLMSSYKQLALGIIPVNQDDVPSVLSLERDLFFAIERYGAEQIWGITPTCGQRMCELEKARERTARLAEVADRFGEILVRRRV